MSGEAVYIIIKVQKHQFIHAYIIILIEMYVCYINLLVHSEK